MGLRLRLLNAYLRRVEKPWMAQDNSPEAFRAAFERSGRLFRKPPFAHFQPDRLGDVPCLWAQVRPRHPGAILYLHGGGYFMGSPTTHHAMLARLSAMTGLRACLPDYRLAPEHIFPAALEDAWTVWQALLARGYPPEAIVIGGDSAGGGLALALLARICADGGARPAASFAFSPWTDLTLSGASMSENEQSDVLLPASRSPETRDTYLGAHNPADPGASPLFAAFPGCPPVFLQSSMVEILRDDTLRMAKVLRRDGAEVTLDMWEDTPHVWPIFQGWLPEADEALHRIAGFIAARILEPRPFDN